MIGIARSCRPLSLLLPALALWTCFLPSEPEDKRLRVTFATNPSPLVVALRDTASVALSVMVDGKPATSPVHYTLEPADAHLAVTADGRAVGLVRGQGGLRVTVVSSASGANPVDTVLPVSVILKRIVVTNPPDTLTAFGDTLVVRPGYRDGRGAPLTPAESSAVVAQFTLVSSGRAVHANGTALVAYANGVDTVQVGADTAHAAFAVVVRQRATRLRGQPDTLRLIALTETWQLTDSAFDRRNHPVGAHTTSWRSTNTAVATTTISGFATAVANGSAFLIGTVDGALDTVPVLVAQTAKRIQVSSGGGQNGTVGALLAAPFVVQLADSLGFAAATAGVQVTFRVDSGGGSIGGAASAVAVSDAQGRAAATLKLGAVAGVINGVSASGNGLVGAATFTAVGGPAAAYKVVLVAGGGQAVGAGGPLPNPFAVAVRDTFGNAVPNVPVLFSVTAGGGKFGAMDTVTVLSDATGTARATLRVGSMVGSGVNAVSIRGVGLTTAPVTVTVDGLVPVMTVAVTPATDTLNVGGTVQLAAVTRDSAGNTLAGRPFVWGSSAPAVATVDTTGKVTAAAAGDATIQAQAEEKTGAAVVTVLGPATALVVTPDTVRLRSLDTAWVTATLRDAAGHALSGTPAWNSSDTTIATVTTNGKITARFDGATFVRATSAALADTVRVIVTAIPVSSVDLEPKTVTLYAAGATSQLTATAVDSASHPIPTARFQFASDNTTVATVSASGLVTAVAAGTANVSVVSGTKSDHIAVRVESSQFTCAGTGGTTHSGTITASETWLKTGSPHRVTSHTFVSNGAVLTIEPGALVCLGGAVSIQPQNGGRLVAVGTSADHIVFTALTTGQPWGGLSLQGTPADTSRLAFTRIEFSGNPGGIWTSSTHPVTLDSVLIRQAQGPGLSLAASGSRATRSVIESAALASAGAAVVLSAGTSLDGVLVQGSGGVGVAIQGLSVKLNNVRIQASQGIGLDVQNGASVAQATGLRIVGGSNYPVRAASDLSFLAAVPAESLLGNHDTLDLTGSPVITKAQVTASPLLPWRVEANVTVDTQAVLVVQPGARFAMGSGVSFVFQRGGRLSARGTAANPIVWTRSGTSDNWGSLYFAASTPPSDSSYLTNVRLEYPSFVYGYSGTAAAVRATGSHAVVLDSVLIRQAQFSAVDLEVSGSRLSRSEIDTSGLGGGMPAVIPGAGVKVEATTIRRASGVGIDLTNSGSSALQAAITGNVVTGGLSYPLRAFFNQMALLSPADQANLVGNAQDSIDVYGGTLTNATVTVTAALPWRVEGYVTVDTGGVLVVQPGARLAIGLDDNFTFQRGGRLSARGTAASPILWTRFGTSGTWGGLYFTSSTPPSDSSYLTNARLEYPSYNTNNAAVYANGAHRLVLDSVLIRQTQAIAVRLDVAGSRLSRSEIDTSGTSGSFAAVQLGTGVKIEGTTIRRASGVGLDLANQGSSPQAAVTGNVITGGLSYPLRAYLNQLALLSPADQGNLVGNARDSIEMMGGTLTGTTLTVTTATIPWRMEGSITVDTQAVLIVQPGVRLAMASGVSFWFQRGGRLQARGTQANPIVFTALSPSQPWSGFQFNGTPPDSSYLTNALIEYVNGSNTSSVAVFAASPTHPVVLDSVHVRQVGRTAMQLTGVGSRLSRSTIDTSGTEGTWTAVGLAPGTAIEGTTIRGATGLGLDLAGQGSSPQKRVSGNVITGGLSYPLRAYINQVALLSLADQGNLVGNAKDTVEVYGGTLTSTTLTLTPVLPWRMDNTITVDTQAVLVVQPGVRFVMVGGPSFIFQRGGRLSARGTAASPIVWTRSGTSGYWGGLYFTSNTPPSDSSYLTNARLEYPSLYNGAAVFATGAHPLVLDSVLIRQAQGSAVRLDVAGSRLSRSEIDTAGTGAADNAITLQTGTKVEATTVRKTSGVGIVVNGPGVRITGTRVLAAAGVGIDASNQTIADFTGSRVTGGASYPVRIGLGSLQAPGMILDSLLGNASDTLVITGGSARVGSFLDRPSLPWRVEGLVIFDSATVLTVQPGAGMALAQNAQVKFTNSGRLVAHGTASQPIRFTAVNPASPWGGLTFEGRSGVYLSGMPRDTSVLINARLEYGGTYTAVQSSGKHVVIVDSTEIRQSAGQAVYLNSPLSRISRSSIDTTTSGSAAVSLGDSTFLDTVTVRRAANTGVYVMGSHVHLAGASVFQAQGTGLDAGQGQLTQGAPVRVTGSALYPLRTTLDNLRLIMPDTVAQDSLRGNGKDTVLIVGGTLTSSSQVMRQVLPWVFQGTGFFEAGAVLTIRPGIAFQMPSGVSLYFQNGGRLIARGTAALPIQFGPSDIANPWNGLLFQGSPGDSSYLTDVVIFRAQGVNGWAVQARDSHPLVMDSVSVRQSRYNGVDLESPGSRFSRSTVDSTSRNNSGVIDNSGTGLNLGSSTLAEASTIRNAGGVGVEAYGSSGIRVLRTRVLGSRDVGIDANSGLTDLTGTRVTGGASYPLRGQIQSIALAVADSMVGNARDSLDVTGGTLTAATATATPTLPWRVDGGVTVDTQALLVVQPGAHLAMGSHNAFFFQRGGRLQARGAQASPIVFTALTPSQPWSGLYFSTTTADSSYLTNAVLEYADGNNTSGAAVFGASATHAVILDSLRLRQLGRTAVQLIASGSRLSHSTIDTAGTEGTSTGVVLGIGVKMEATTIRRASGLGLDLASQGNGLQSAVTGNVITGGLSYPLRAYVEQLARVSPADQANLVGNTRDTLEIVGGTLTGATLTVTPALPWRLEGWVNVDTQAVLAVQPGGGLSMAGNVALLFVRGGRLNARGTAGSPVRFGAITSSQPWSGMSFNSSTPPSDSSYLTNAVVEYANGYNTASAAVYGASSNYPVVLDTTRIRQSSRSAVVLNGVGSRLSRSTIDTSGIEGAYAAVAPGTGTKVEATTIRRAGGIGMDLSYLGSGTQTAVTGNAVTGGLSYPLRGYINQLALLSPADQATLAGNARDSIDVSGGTLTNATLTMASALPWRVDGNVNVDTEAVLVVQPGAKLAMGSGVSWIFQRGGLLSAKGIGTSPTLWTSYNTSGNWGGLYFTSSTMPNDSSYLTNARLEYPTYYSGAAAVYATGAHPLVLDSVLIRQAQYTAVGLNSTGSRLSRSEVDTAGMAGYPAVALSAQTTLEGTRIRRTLSYAAVYANGSNINIAQNEIANSVSHGIYLSGTLTGLAIANCNLVNNGGYGIYNTTGTPVTANSIWWDSASGPPGSNGGGAYGNVTVTSWLGAPFTIPVPFP